MLASSEGLSLLGWLLLPVQSAMWTSAGLCLSEGPTLEKHLTWQVWEETGKNSIFCFSALLRLALWVLHALNGFCSKFISFCKVTATLPIIVLKFGSFQSLCPSDFVLRFIYLTMAHSPISKFHGILPGLGYGVATVLWRLCTCWIPELNIIIIPSMIMHMTSQSVYKSVIL